MQYRRNAHLFVTMLLAAMLGSLVALPDLALAQFAPTLATGVVAPVRSVTIASKMMGRITQVTVDEGDHVDGNAVLVVLAGAEL